jgi:hypothetical protein
VIRHSFWFSRTTRGGSSVMGNSGEAAAGMEQGSEERGHTREETRQNERRLPR